MSKEDDGSSLFARLRQFLQGEPQNQEELIGLLRDAQSAHSLIQKPGND